MEISIRNYENFFKYIKKWTVNDYYTAGIKAEVIIDMLLSEYVSEIVQKTIGEKGRSVKLVAKEFPIKAKPNKKKPDTDAGNRSAKIDYLLYDGETTYIVELKTDNQSFDLEQYNNYVNRIKGKELFQIFENIIKMQKGKNYPKFEDYRSIINGNELQSYESTQKYIFTFLRIIKSLYPDKYIDILGSIKEGDNKVIEENLKAIKKTLNFESAEKFKLVYLSLRPIDDDKKDKNFFSNNEGIKAYNIYFYGEDIDEYKKVAKLPENDNRWNSIIEIISCINNANYAMLDELNAIDNMCTGY